MGSELVTSNMCKHVPVCSPANAAMLQVGNEWSLSESLATKSYNCEFNLKTPSITTVSELNSIEYLSV